jgi:hypothetical protein
VRLIIPKIFIVEEIPYDPYFLIHLWKIKMADLDQRLRIRELFILKHCRKARFKVLSILNW